jgi:CTP synthase (EC 6.3.4.2)
MERLNLAEEAIITTDRTNTWRELVTRERTSSVDVALVGKYDLEDAYMSVHEALKHAGIETQTEVTVQWVDSDEMLDHHEDRLREADGVVVPGGFGSRGIAGKLKAIEYCREHNVPFLGLCLGFQMAVVEHAQNVLGFADAHSAELQPETPHPVIDILPEQYDVETMGGTMRLGAHETNIDPNTLAAAVYNGTVCTERHRHRYEVNPEYIDKLEAGALSFSGQANNEWKFLSEAIIRFSLEHSFTLNSGRDLTVQVHHS